MSTPRKTRICHLSSVHLANDTRLFYRQCVSLAKLYDVYLVAIGEANGEWYGVNVRAIKPRASRLGRFLLNIPSVFFKGLATGAKVFHFHDPELIPVGLLLWLMGKKVIYDIHEDVAQLMKLKKWVPFPRLVVGIYKFFEWFALKAFTIIVSEDAYQRLYPRTRTHVIHNFAFIDKLLIYRKQERSGNELNLFYIGSLDELYCLFETLEAIYMLTQRGYQLHATFVGKLSPRIERQMEALPFYNLIRHHLTFHGYLSAEDGFQYSTSASIGMCLVNENVNSYESYPRKMFEYMSIGLPLITSDFPLYKQVVEQNKCGLCIDASSPEAIATAIEQLHNNPELRHRMGLNGIDAAVKLYDWKQEETKLLGLYHNILN